MRRVTRLHQRRRGRGARLLLFLMGGLLLGYLLMRALTGLEPHSVGKNLPPPKMQTKVSPVQEETKDSFTFYEVLEQRNPDGSELMPLVANPPPPAEDRVYQKPVTPLSEDQPLRRGEEEGKSYTVQVAALGDKAAAQSLVARLFQRGYPAYLFSQTTPGKGLLYRVRIGHYPKREEAEGMIGRLLKSEQLKGFVVLERS